MESSDGCTQETMSFVDKRHGWLALDGGVIAATTDGGNTWADRYTSSEAQASIQDIDFIDSVNGYALVSWGGPGTKEGIPLFEDVIRTVDGGRTWSVATPSSFGITCLDFVSPSVGYAVTSNSQLAVTADGGAHWAGVKTPGAPVTACFEADGAGWIGTEQGVDRTSDGGAHWSQTYAPTGILNERISASDRVQCFGHSAWLFMNLGSGMNQEAAVILRTLNDGAQWQAIDNQGIGGPFAGTPSAPDILEAHPGPFQLTGPDDASLTSFNSVNVDVRFTVTSDGGLSVTQHQVVRDPNDESWVDVAALSFVTPDVGWLLLDASNLRVMTSASLTPLDGGAQLAGMSPDNRILLQTSNAGSSWSVLATFTGSRQVSG